MAWCYQQYAKEQRPEERVDCAQAEAHAKENKIGVWNRNNPTPPWEWRHQRRENR